MSLSVLDIKRIMQPVYRKVALMLAKLTVESCNDSGDEQSVQVTVLDGEVMDGLEKSDHYGFTSVPKSGASGIGIFLSGTRENGIVISTDDTRYRIKNMSPGEVALYTDEGDQIYFQRGRIVKIIAGSKLEIDTPELTVTGKITAGGDVKGGTISLQNHIHAEHDGGNTATPTG